MAVLHMRRPSAEHLTIAIHFSKELQMNKALLIFFAMLVLVQFGSNAKADEKPMNVLLIMCDDMNTWPLGDKNRYAGKVVAPNIINLGKSGVIFKHAYTASPVCSPSRSAFFSGIHPWRSGHYQNGTQHGMSVPLQNQASMPQLFREKGYFTGSFGKITHGWNPKESWDESDRHGRNPTPPNAPLMPLGRGENDWGVIHIPESQMVDTLDADAAIKALQAHQDEPFFIAYGTFTPHMPWYVPQKYFDMFPLKDLPEPPINLDDLSDIPPLGQANSNRRKEWVKQLIEIGEYKKGVQAYLATIAYADAQVGRVIDALEKSGQADNTIVFMVSDHGFHLGEKLNWQKNSLWEEATHSLMMARVPGITEPGGVCERFVSLQDVYPTIAELCGITPPQPIDGRSLLPLLKKPDAAWQSTAITAHLDQHITIRTDRFRYIRYNEEQEELYDFEKDPYAWTNVIDDPAYAEELAKLRAAVPSREDMAPQLPLADRSKKRKKDKKEDNAK